MTYRQQSTLFSISFNCSCNFVSMNCFDVTSKTININRSLSSSYDIFRKVTVVTIKIREIISNCIFDDYKKLLLLT